MFRSEKLSLYKLTAPKDYARELMLQIGGAASVHLVDMNQNELAIKKNFANHLKRVEDTLISLRILQDLLNDSKGQLCETDEDESPQLKLKQEDYAKHLPALIATSGKSEKHYFDVIAEEVQRRVKFFQEQQAANDELIQGIQKSEEELLVLRIFNLQLPESFRNALQVSSSQLTRPTEAVGLREPRAPLIRYICATLDTADLARVQKMIYRLSRGKVISMVYSLEGTSSLTSKPSTAKQAPSSRSVLFAAYPSMANMDQSMGKVDELLEALGANRITLSRKSFIYKCDSSRRN